MITETCCEIVPFTRKIIFGSKRLGIKKKELLINDCNKYCDGISAKFRLEKAFIPISPCYRRKLGPIASLYRLVLTKVS